MNRRTDPQLRECLAAEYALGTLRGRARARLRRALREDATLARSVAEWEERLTPLCEAIQPFSPAPRVWREIEARVRPTPENEGLWQRLRFWRGLGLAASAACAAFVAMTVVLTAQKPALPASYIAVLSDPKTARPVLVVSAGRKDAELQVKTLDPSIHVANASLELWAIPKGARPRSLGLVAAGRGSLRLAAVADQSLADVPMLAVSLEPKGGSPTGAPSGPVLYSGPCVKYW